MAQPPVGRACEVDRAGFTEALVTGIKIKWININVAPMVRGANCSPGECKPKPFEANPFVTSKLG